MKTFDDEINSGLVWMPELGMGRYPVPKERPYDEGYFARYREMADTQLGRDLTAARIRLVERHYGSGPVLDVGIGAGQFVEARPNTQGFDVNPAGIEWLQQRGQWADLYADRYLALTFWDSLEHIDRPDVAVGKANKWVFVSVPLFDSGDDIPRSKHFRPDEHIWYWTREGLVNWFKEQGFTLAEGNDIETQLGREGIGSYAFFRG